MGKFPTDGKVSEIGHIPKIPGGAGWIFIGYYDPKMTGFIGARLRS
jgi:hypothetical protein